MLRNIARAAAIALIAVVGVVACSDDQQACAASWGNAPKPPSQPKPPKVNQPKPGQQRTTSKVQDKTQPKATTKPTSWSGYNDRVQNRKWDQPYRKGYPVAQQPVIINQYGHDYRTYPGYYGYYPIGVWPMGYGHTYGCVADQEGDPTDG